MPYLIIKKMTNPQNGKTIFTVLNDGLSQIMEVKDKKKATKLVNLFNENSDSGWVYEIKEICEK
tara:strand:- start:390 stop:581 length:192 start_codon:yes stop_codon:yes gene_type:complete